MELEEIMVIKVVDLTHFSIAMKKQCDQGNSYERKSNWSLLTISEA